MKEEKEKKWGKETTDDWYGISEKKKVGKYGIWENESAAGP